MIVFRKANIRISESADIKTDYNVTIDNLQVTIDNSSKYDLNGKNFS